MCERVLCVLLLLTAAALAVHAQTPVEEVITKYEDVKGARCFVADGPRMVFARNLLKRTQVAPIAPDVDKLAVLKMEDAPQHSRSMFDLDLDDALKKYDHYGKHDSQNGTVDIYILHGSGDSVKELVIFNPSIWSLNSLYGNFTVHQLLELDSEK